MQKRLSRTDYLFAFTFIFMFACAVAAFFYGMEIGKEKTAERYEKVLESRKASAQELSAYHQQYLVSFYHTIYLPYREFENKWFEDMNAIAVRGADADPAALMNQIGKRADETYKEIVIMSMPKSSPLLQEAHQNYLKSLKLFADAAKNFVPKAGSETGAVWLSQIEQDAYFQEAKNFALQAQKDYYASMIKWYQSSEPGLKGADAAEKANLSVKDWSKLNVVVKNGFIAGLMKSRGYFEPFYPQDLTVRVDELIRSGQADKLKLNTVGDIVQLLVSTKAVRPGDFIQGKDRWYGRETLPQLPFFFEQK